MEYVKETVEFGNVKKALKAGLFGWYDLLTFLGETQVTLRTCIAFVHLLRYVKEFDPDVIMSKVPAYCKLLAIIVRGTDMGEDANRKYDEIVAFGHEKYGELLNSEIDCIDELHEFLLLESHKLSPRAKNTPFILAALNKLSFAVLREYPNICCPFLEFDRFSMINPKAGISLDDVLSRVDILKDNAPNYFEKVVSRKYGDLLNGIIATGVNITDQSLRTIERLFSPHIFSGCVSIVAKKLHLMEISKVAYYLGFPLHEAHPGKNKELICSYIKKYETLGKEKYIEEITNYNKRKVVGSGLFLSEPLKVANEETVMLEATSNYLPFDLVYFNDGGYLYTFARCEFEEILRSKKNPWNNEYLPVSILSTIVSRMETAELLNLPPCSPLTDVYDQLEAINISQESNENNSTNTVNFSDETEATNVFPLFEVQNQDILEYFGLGHLPPLENAFATRVHYVTIPITSVDGVAELSNNSNN